MKFLQLLLIFAIVFCTYQVNSQCGASEIELQLSYTGIDIDGCIEVGDAGTLTITAVGNDGITVCDVNEAVIISSSVAGAFSAPTASLISGNIAVGGVSANTVGISSLIVTTTSGITGSIDDITVGILGGCAEDCPILGVSIGATCDDGDDATIDDEITADCLCIGALVPLDCEGVPNGSAIAGTDCDDENINTINDVFNENCECSGEELVSVCEEVLITVNSVSYDCDFGLAISSVGGEGPITYKAFQLPNATGFEVGANSDLDNGFYVFVAIDANGCTSNLSSTIDINCPLDPCDLLIVSLVDYSCQDGIQLAHSGATTVTFFAYEDVAIPGEVDFITNGTVLETGDYRFYAVNSDCTSDALDYYVNCEPDCANVNGGDNIPGVACDDDDELTENDTWSDDCECIGIYINPDCEGTPNGTAIEGTDCDDDNDNTLNDTWNDDCECKGQYFVTLQSKLLLEGVYDAATEEMLSSVYSNIELPVGQPFNMQPFNYVGDETSENVPLLFVADWVFVQLRAENKWTIVAEKAVLLSTEGFLIDPHTGEEEVLFVGVEPGDYYVVLYNIGHLGIMSANKLSLPNSLPLDFSYDITYTMGVEQLKEQDGVYLMYAGDHDNNGVINNIDLNFWQANSAAVGGYYPYDLNQNGVVNVTDYNIWFSNRSKVGILEIQL